MLFSPCSLVFFMCCYHSILECSVIPRYSYFTHQVFSREVFSLKKELVWSEEKSKISWATFGLCWVDGCGAAGLSVFFGVFRECIVKNIYGKPENISGGGWWRFGEWTVQVLSVLSWSLLGFIKTKIKKRCKSCKNLNITFPYYFMMQMF